MCVKSRKVSGNAHGKWNDLACIKRNSKRRYTHKNMYYACHKTPDTPLTGSGPRFDLANQKNDTAVKKHNIADMRP